MLSKEIIKAYKPSIGIECHVQLKTKTKLFSAVSNEARDALPNTLISHIDLGMPGALPVLNENAVKLGIRAALALGTKPQSFSKFDRKHYFYPDLPMGYQITQFYNPIIKDGLVVFSLGEREIKVRIHEAHLEADAGKNVHPAGKDYSLVDLNRAGTPLLEIVSEPDLHSPSEAKAYVRELWLLMRYAGVSDADLYQGNMRFDVNVSVSKNDELGTRTETKNLNSFRSVEKAVEYEIKRQIEILEKGETVVQETRGWDEAKQKTTSQRGKEEAHDYRYMPDPDLPPVVIDESLIEAIKEQLPPLPGFYRDQFTKIGLDKKTIEAVIASPEMAETVLQVLHEGGNEHAKRVAFWLLQEQSDTDKPKDSLSLKTDIHELIKLSKLVGENKLSSTSGKQVFAHLQNHGGDALKTAEKLNLIQESDEAALLKVVDEVITNNEQAASDVRNGETKAIGYLVGQVMKMSKGRANPEIAQALLKKRLLAKD